MDCETAYNLISARIDGQIGSADSAALDAHLAQCPGCRSTLQALTAQDQALTAAFAPRKESAAAVAQRVISRIRTEGSPQARSWRIGFLPMLLSAAAGFVVALLIFRPWAQPNLPAKFQTADSQPAQAAPIAHLSVATGPIDFRCPGKDWQTLPTGGSVPADTQIRTGPNVRCEFVMNDGSEVRINSKSQLTLCAPRKFSLEQGQMFSNVVPAAAPFQVDVAQATVTALGTEFDLQNNTELCSLACVQGSVKVQGKASTAVVKTGQRCSIQSGNPTSPKEDYNLLLATRWVNDLLVLKGRDNAELNRRVNELFAQIGQTKMRDLYEEEIRSLGDRCVVPLTRYIQSNISQTDSERGRRVEAARILSDLAQPWSIGDLIPLLNDPDSSVRYYAARALHRLRGNNDFGRTPEQWRDDPAGSQAAYRQWQAWWEKNKSALPVPPTSDQFK